jgi:hypothetical protein
LISRGCIALAGRLRLQSINPKILHWALVDTARIGAPGDGRNSPPSMHLPLEGSHAAPWPAWFTRSSGWAGAGPVARQRRWHRPNRDLLRRRIRDILHDWRFSRRALICLNDDSSPLVETCALPRPEICRER